MRPDIFVINFSALYATSIIHPVDTSPRKWSVFPYFAYTAADTLHCQHTAADTLHCQHTTADTLHRQHTTAYTLNRQHTAADTLHCQHTTADTLHRQYTNADTLSQYTTADTLHRQFSTAGTLRQYTTTDTLHRQYTIACTLHQGCTSLPKVCETDQNSRRQKSEMKRIPQTGPTNMRQISRSGYLAPEICASLYYTVSTLLPSLRY